MTVDAEGRKRIQAWAAQWPAVEQATVAAERLERDDPHRPSNLDRLLALRAAARVLFPDWGRDPDHDPERQPGVDQVRATWLKLHVALGPGGSQRDG